MTRCAGGAAWLVSWRRPERSAVVTPETERPRIAHEEIRIARAVCVVAEDTTAGEERAVNKLAVQHEIVTFFAEPVGGEDERVRPTGFVAGIAELRRIRPVILTRSDAHYLLRCPFGGPRLGRALGRGRGDPVEKEREDTMTGWPAAPRQKDGESTRNEPRPASPHGPDDPLRDVLRKPPG
jgi:hypothetical protein